MLQTVIQLSRQSRTTSYSISFQPFMLFSTSTWGLVANALLHSALSWSSFCAKPEPRLPSAYAARTMTGYPIVFAAAIASSSVVAVLLCAQRSPICAIALANSSRSSVMMIVSIGVPSILQPSAANSYLSLMPTLSAVYPSKVT